MTIQPIHHFRLNLSVPGIHAERKVVKPGRGHNYRNQMRIVIGFDPETFAQIEALAAKEGVSFAEKVRQLTEWGLMDQEAA